MIVRTCSITLPPYKKQLPHLHIDLCTQRKALILIANPTKPIAEAHDEEESRH